MTVTPHRQLHQSCAAIVELLVANRHHPLVSLAFPLPKVDPLVALQSLSQTDHPYFYWEHGDQAIAMLDVAVAQDVGGVDRFVQAQEFMQATSESLHVVETEFAPKPRCYCRFPFFDRALSATVPFATSQICLPKWQISRSRGASHLVVNLRLDAVTDLRLVAAEISARIDQLIKLAGRSLTTSRVEVQLQTDVDAIDLLETAISKSLGAIDRQELQKIVLAHSCVVTATQDFSIPRCLDNLRQHHPDCYTFAINDGWGNCFVGASPERLVSVSDRQLVCDALAGSAPRSQFPQSDRQFAQQLLANGKEQHEHQLVRDFIVDSLQKLGLDPQWSPQPQLLALTNIQHVWTPIQAVLTADLDPLAVVAALHPTPAVAGLPRQLACEKIQELEAVARSLYAAPIGWIDTEGNCEVVVGIRSAIVTGNQARLFAGAGIVAGSEIDREVAEIQLKFQSLYQALSG
jgi:menaquinone-specific isochorismate synthase